MFKKIKNHEIKENVFKLIEKDCFLLTAAKPDGSVNTMAAQWGTLGHLWGKNVAIAFVRPQRYTHEFVTESEFFSLSFFPEDYRDALMYMGKVSGRDEDKIAAKGLNIRFSGTEGEVSDAAAAAQKGAPYFEEARLVLNCKKLYTGKIEKENFDMPEIDAKVYAAADYHTVVIGEIEECLLKE